MINTVFLCHYKSTNVPYSFHSEKPTVLTQQFGASSNKTKKIQQQQPIKFNHSVNFLYPYLLCTISVVLDLIVVCVVWFCSFPSAIMSSGLCSRQIMNIYAWRNSVASVLCTSPSNSATIIPNFYCSRLCCCCSEKENTKMFLNITFIIYGLNQTEPNFIFS